MADQPQRIYFQGDQVDDLIGDRRPDRARVFVDTFYDNGRLIENGLGLRRRWGQWSLHRLEGDLRCLAKGKDRVEKRLAQADQDKIELDKTFFHEVVSYPIFRLSYRQPDLRLETAKIGGRFYTVASTKGDPGIGLERAARSIPLISGLFSQAPTETFDQVEPTDQVPVHLQEHLDQAFETTSRLTRTWPDDMNRPERIDYRQELDREYSRAWDAFALQRHRDRLAQALEEACYGQFD